nr:TonB family protein [Pedobacter sp. SYSU D00535]
MTKSGVRVSGTVIDKEDGTPIPGVAVKVKGYPIGTSTDTEGRFVITVPEKGDAIEVISLGYEKEQIKISKADSLTIALKPNLAALSEVVVSSPQEAVETRPAEPVMGWNAYRKYLKSKATSPDGKKGSVTLSFTVSPAGEVGNAKVIKGLSEEVNKKALQLILEGPAWKGPSDGLTKEIRLRVKFR